VLIFKQKIMTSFVNETKSNHTKNQFMLLLISFELMFANRREY